MTSSDDNRDGELRLGIVGCGGAAADVVQAVARVPGLRVTGLHDRDRALAEGLARVAGGEVHGDLASLLTADAVDAVDVAVPHDLLVPIGQEVLDAGRHVLLETPMAVDLESLDRLAAQA